MNKKVRIITLCVLAIMIVICVSLGITKAFMKPIEDTSSVTEVSLSSCAKISLTDKGSINLSNTYPMSKNRALNTTPYSFTVTSSCDSFVGFNLYLATFNTNTLDASKIHYIITEVGSKEIITEGLVGNATNVTSTFTDQEKTEYNVGMQGNIGTIYQLYNANIPYKGSTSYDLYLYVDEDATNVTAGQTFNAGIAVKSYDTEPTLANYIRSLYTTQGANHLYLHDSTLANSAEDGSYRYAGGDYRVADKYKENYGSISDIVKFEIDPDTTANPDEYNRYYISYESPRVYYDNPKNVLNKLINDGYIVPDSVDNYVCFGSDLEVCPHHNLYRVIGVFDNNVKLIKADYATEDQLGNDGEFLETKTLEEWRDENWFIENYNDGDLKSKNEKFSFYSWNKLNSNITFTKYGNYNIWQESAFNKINLNTNFINNLGVYWSSKILYNTWFVNGLDSEYFYNSTAKLSYEYEVGKNKNLDNEFSKFESKIGLMYVSDYLYSAIPNYWNFSGYNENHNCVDSECLFMIGDDYSRSTNENWIYLGEEEWLITRYSDYKDTSGIIFVSGSVDGYSVNNVSKMARPTFYLNSDVAYAGGSGTETDPYRIA